MLHVPTLVANQQAPEDSVRPKLRVLLAAPRGFCAGVRRAIDAVRDALAVHGAPVYVRRPIVHNLDVVRSLEAEGAIFVEELSEVPAGSVVVLSAHGVAPAVLKEASDLGLRAFDAVCPLVAKVHREIERHHRRGRHVVIIGHHGHPEIEGTIGRLPKGAASVVSSIAEVEGLPLRREAPVAYAVQTTYSVDEAEGIVAALHARFAKVDGPSTSDICYATTNRQAAVREVAARADAVIVVGESFSSNAARLAEVASLLCPNVQLVARSNALDVGRLAQAKCVAISAAASTPESSVQAVISLLEERFCVSIEEIEAAREDTVFKRLAIANLD
ncbi:4-hydroxy-3-methylbut-2-enyl diphosphate reductase [Sphingomonas sinipercae]|uniref:4-hydroxy-3-methylbut-2-enyl diphosphate reductase n=1 Tax=Sphingomonas sinipercae TaxID=2714944 RepID=A0A6G7ZMG6_9SPHN|nr:4-hydroxy-3-methylbut-2-enyl diphosphate reductase [Sphingomonas sinipercae]QIL02109.1 4-hydroxy-3-methylbut-2-enyl diphosphate reductase [Sphingomonas sinipercae]